LVEVTNGNYVYGSNKKNMQKMMMSILYIESNLYIREQPPIPINTNRNQPYPVIPVHNQALSPKAPQNHHI